MSVGDPIVIERSEDGIDWQPWMTLHCLNVVSATVKTTILASVL